MKSFKVMKKAESEPTVFGMALIPLAISGITLFFSILVIVAAPGVITAIVALIVFLTAVFSSNYIYNSKVFDRMADNEHPKEIHNDI